MVALDHHRGIALEAKKWRQLTHVWESSHRGLGAQRDAGFSRRELVLISRETLRPRHSALK